MFKLKLWIYLLIISIISVIAIILIYMFLGSIINFHNKCEISNVAAFLTQLENFWTKLESS